MLKIHKNVFTTSRTKIIADCKNKTRKICYKTNIANVDSTDLRIVE